MAILMISSELPEILGMSDRILVMREGRLTGRVQPRRSHPGKTHGRRDGRIDQRQYVRVAAMSATD